MEGYFWVANSNDGWHDESSMVFSSQEDAYKNMRTAALEKMKWNTEFEDFGAGEPIDYKVVFYPHKIIHTSYSGVYTYEICVLKRLKEE